MGANSTARAFTDDGNLIRISARQMDVVLSSVQRCQTIPDQNIWCHVFSVGVHPAIRTKPVVRADGNKSSPQAACPGRSQRDHPPTPWLQKRTIIDQQKLITMTMSYSPHNRIASGAREDSFPVFLLAP